MREANLQAYKPGGQRCEFRYSLSLKLAATVKKAGTFARVDITRELTRRRIYAYYRVNSLTVTRIYQVQIALLFGKNLMATFPAVRSFAGNSALDPSQIYQNFASDALYTVPLVNSIRIQDESDTLRFLHPIEANTEADAVELQLLTDCTGTITDFYLGCYSEN